MPIDQDEQVLPNHLGSFIWRNGAEMVWECADACTHPSHDREAHGLPSCPTSLTGHPNGCRCR